MSYLGQNNRIELSGSTFQRTRVWEWRRSSPGRDRIGRRALTIAGMRLILCVDAVIAAMTFMAGSPPPCQCARQSAVSDHCQPEVAADHEVVFAHGISEQLLDLGLGTEGRGTTRVCRHTVSRHFEVVTQNKTNPRAG